MAAEPLTDTGDATAEIIGISWTAADEAIRRARSRRLRSSDEGPESWTNS